jgi:hypothetical protein
MERETNLTVTIGLFFGLMGFVLAPLWAKLLMLAYLFLKKENQTP